jgi:hypothetical protein
MTEKRLRSIIKKYEKENKCIYGLISLDYILAKAPIDQLIQFGLNHKISRFKYENMSRNEIIYQILDSFYIRFNSKDPFTARHPDLLSYLGDFLLEEIDFATYDFNFDFISKTELLDVFADYCADLEIYVYKADDSNEFGLDLYLTKKSKGIEITTESVFIRTGNDIYDDYENGLQEKIKAAKILSDWTVFVTTPAGVMRVGFNNLISDMKKLNTKIYVIDPIQKNVIGVIKGEKSKKLSTEVRDAYIRTLPPQPFRSHSNIGNYLKYNYSERDFYKLRNISSYSLTSKYFEWDRIQNPLISAKYSDILQSVLIIEKSTTLTAYSYSNEQTQVNDQLISGFLSAISSFGTKVSGSSELEEISYEGFIIYEENGNLIKAIAILSQRADQAFKDRLKIFVKAFEDEFEDELEEFKNISAPDFNKGDVDKFIKYYLAV